MKKFNKKPLIFAGLLVLVALIGYTIAYYYSEVVIPNRFQSMTYNVQVREEFNNTYGTKRVYFVNQEETNTPVVLRISYNEQFRINGLLQNNKVNGVDRVTKTWTSAFTNDFELYSDGWYYYKKVLNPQTEVQVLESIQYNGTAPSNSEYHLDFNFEAIQATEEAVSDIWNRTMTINGDNVLWVQ